MGSERDFFTTQGHLAGSGMSQFRAIAAWPCGGVGPIRGAASGDDASLRGGPPPHTAGSIKGGYWGRSCSLSFVSIHHRLDSASTLLTPPTRSYLPLHPIARDSTPSDRSRLHSPNSSTSFTPTVASRRDLPEARDDTPAFGEVSHHGAFAPNVLVARSGNQLYQVPRDCSLNLFSFLASI